MKALRRAKVFEVMRISWSGSLSEVLAFIGKDAKWDASTSEIIVETARYPLPVYPGSYVIKHRSGRLEVLTSEEFNADYELLIPHEEIAVETAPITSEYPYDKGKRISDAIREADENELWGG